MIEGFDSKTAEYVDMGKAHAVIALAGKHDELRRKFSGEKNYAELYLKAMEKHVESLLVTTINMSVNYLMKGI